VHFNGLTANKLLTSDRTGERERRRMREREKEKGKERKKRGVNVRGL